MLCAFDLTEEANCKNHFVLRALVGKSNYKVLGGRVNRRNERLIGGMKLAGPPCVMPSKTPMFRPRIEFLNLPLF